MEPFEITLVDQKLNIKPRLDNAFEVFEADKKIGTVQAVIVAGESKWISKDLNADYAKQIGELIDEHQL
jgi:hypothetical protein